MFWFLREVYMSSQLKFKAYLRSSSELRLWIIPSILFLRSVAYLTSLYLSLMYWMSRFCRSSRALSSLKNNLTFSIALSIYESSLSFTYRIFCKAVPWLSKLWKVPSRCLKSLANLCRHIYVTLVNVNSSALLGCRFLWLSLHL
jgi:hypothetical protein